MIIINYYIYKIENKINHKIYIGLTCNIKRRHFRHFSDLRCNRHDNKFMQSEFNKYGEDNFEFTEILNGDYTDYEIGELEKKYIKIYDSYKNGYNQNEGGNFGASNGGTKLTLSDLLNILSALEFMNRPGQVLSEMFGVTKTTISRIKKGTNHEYAFEKYNSMTFDKRKELYNNFIKTTEFYERKIKTSIIKNKRKLNKNDIFMILYNNENKIMSKAKLARILHISSVNTINSILKGTSYKDYVYEYKNLKQSKKNKIATLFSNE